MIRRKPLPPLHAVEPLTAGELIAGIVIAISGIALMYWLAGKIDWTGALFTGSH